MSEIGSIKFLKKKKINSGKDFENSNTLMSKKLNIRNVEIITIKKMLNDRSLFKYLGIYFLIIFINLY